MAHTTTLAPTVPVRRRGRPVHKTLTLAKGWFRAYVAWRNRKLTEAVLRGLDDRTLKDIGLSRSEIAAVALLGGRLQE